MPYPQVANPSAARHEQARPHLSTYDSGQECSLAHWLEVCRLVETAERDDSQMKGYVFDDECLLVSE